ncbi:class I SAM-dependent methyltransferase [Nodosilinea sp. PGN35]|uniref:class I SAM-dependent methyltransferase n=1 Tax=Nodosilinea sp. PGN35 TaxID=3020489 RepID=UPI0023B25C54|nr:class I SAM-dependent methyltransferase [Nodosilinea sp. TSF1-S3]
MNSPTSNAQKQTEETFEFKWKKRATYESPAVQQEWQRWLFEKYFDSNVDGLDDILNTNGGRKSILDAGCGSGGSALLLFGEHLKNHDYLGVDISDAVSVAKERFAERGIPALFAKSDLNSIPSQYGNFDIIFSEGVLHHTDSVKRAIFELSQRLKQDGKFLFYVYRKKAPVREYTDDLIRDSISSLTNEAAWKALESLTKLGKTLGDLNIEIEIEDDIPYLEIEKGKYNLQRLFYYKICKTFYRPDYSLDEMNHINFDWFRPRNCFRHTPEEITEFCTSSGLTIDRLYVEDSGITVIATK